eukprot:1746906-Prymnesium_polylepis.1
MKTTKTNADVKMKRATARQSMRTGKRQHTSTRAGSDASTRTVSDNQAEGWWRTSSTTTNRLMTTATSTCSAIDGVVMGEPPYHNPMMPSWRE